MVSVLNVVWTRSLLVRVKMLTITVPQTPEDLADNLPGIGDKIINYAALSSSDSDSSYGEYGKPQEARFCSSQIP
jgi:hypothetical protein